MDTFERLAEAENELAFFVILCDLLNDDYRKNVHAEIHSRRDDDHGFFVELPIRQVVRVFDQAGIERSVESLTTNTFSLREDGTLIWQIRNRPPLVGLKPIQAELRRLREALEAEPLPETTWAL